MMEKQEPQSELFRTGFEKKIGGTPKFEKNAKGSSATRMIEKKMIIQDSPL